MSVYYYYSNRYILFVACYAKDGIIKAQEWVNAHQNDIVGAHAFAQLPNLSKESLQGYKVPCYLWRPIRLFSV